MFPKAPTDIDRKTASRMLRVSVRTIDRYIRRGKLRARELNGRIWLNKNEVMQCEPGENRDMLRTEVSTQTRKITDSNFYKDLYEEARRALIENQHKLEQTQYRIGQLESQLMHSIPAQNQDLKEDTVSHLLYKRELGDQKRQLETLRKLLHQEKINRTIFAIIAYALLFLLPLTWYLLR